MRSGPVPQLNRDYGLVARFAGPTGNQILVLTGIGDVGVLAAVRSAGTAAGIDQVETLMRSAEIDAAARLRGARRGRWPQPHGLRCARRRRLRARQGRRLHRHRLRLLTTQSDGENVAPSALSVAER